MTRRGTRSTSLKNKPQKRNSRRQSRSAVDKFNAERAAAKEAADREFAEKRQEATSKLLAREAGVEAAAVANERRKAGERAAAAALKSDMAGKAPMPRPGSPVLDDAPPPSYEQATADPSRRPGGAGSIAGPSSSGLCWKW